MGLDLVCIGETFLTGTQGLNIEGYEWFGNNRRYISKRAFRGSGGVGILIRQSILAKYEIATISDNFDGILWLQLINKVSKEQFGLCVCYLPPASSSRGNLSQEFFDTLKALIIENYSLRRISYLWGF